MHRWTVTKEEAGLSLQQFLQKHLKGLFSLKEIKSGLMGLACKRNKKVERFGSVKVNQDDLVEWLEKEKSEKPKACSFEKERILYEDDFFLAYDKPSSCLTMEKGILEEINKSYTKVFPVHRLDKDTTGVLLFAKTEKTAAYLESLFRKKEIHKTYLALVSGLLNKDQESVLNYLGKTGSFSGQTIYGPQSSKLGKFAETEFKVVSHGKEHTLVKCFPKTGRTHQIRSHLKTLGHPIVGDVQYGWEESLPFNVRRTLLHAYSIELTHPDNHKKICIVAKTPLDFNEMETHLIGNLWKER